MKHDPDLLAIQRKRRRERRCVRCGKASGRALLCPGCGADWRYCPECETVYPKTEASRADEGRTSEYCTACDTKRIRRRDGKLCRDDYLAERRAQSNALLKRIIPRYRAGQGYKAIAAALGISQGRLAGIISYARETGRWPVDLARYRTTRKRAERGNADANR